MIVKVYVVIQQLYGLYILVVYLLLLSVSSIYSIIGRRMNMSMENCEDDTERENWSAGKMHVIADSEVEIFSYCLELFGTWHITWTQKQWEGIFNKQHAI
jgi:hypothetical protein